MTTYNTGNPVPSTEVKDLFDNCQTEDEFVNSSELVTVTRLGETRSTLAGLNADFNAFLQKSGFETQHLTYVAGSTLKIDRVTQLVDYNGSVYRVKMPSAFPVTLSGTWSTDSAKLVDIGDSSLRQALASSTGTDLIYQGSQKLTDILNALDSEIDAVGNKVVKIGNPNDFAFGLIKTNDYDYATLSANISPAVSAYTKTNFDANGVHSAGSVGVLTSPISNASTAPIFLLTLEISTSIPGRIKVQTNGGDIFEDQPNGVWYSDLGVMTSGVEQNRTINATTFEYIVRTFNTPITSVRIETDSAWAGTITSIKLQEVSPTKFSIGGAGSGGNGEKNPMGLKVGAFNRNDIAVGDTLTQACFSYDGTSPTPAHNVAFGAQALASNLHGDENTAFGTFALKYNQTSNNVAFGYSASKLNVKGRELVSVGYKAGFSNVIGSRNTLVGFWASGLNNDGNNNTSMGWYAGRNALRGSFNVHIGSQSGLGLGDGSGNTFVGALAGANQGNGAGTYSGQTAIGSETSVYGSNNTVLGLRASIGSTDNPTGITNSTALGYNATVTGAGQVQLGGTGTTPYAYAALQVRSDKRDKTDIKDLEKSESFIKGHKGLAKQYRYDLRELYEDRKPDGTKAGKREHPGFIAQDVAKLCKKLGMDFSGLHHHEINGGSDVWSIAYESYIPHIVNVLSEALVKMDDFESRLKKLES